VSPGLGGPTWHHNATLALSLVAFLATGLVRTRRGRLWSDRAHLGIGVLAWTALAAVSGFLLLYLKPDLKAWELKDWATWWHILWSWLALWYFVTHTWVNRRPLLRALGRWQRTVAGVLAYDGVLLLVFLAVPLTWLDVGPWRHPLVVEADYILLSLWTWLVLAGGPYLAWAVARVRRPRWARRPAVQGFVDVWLLPMALLANLSGFPLLYFDSKSTVLKYVAKAWHTVPSIAFTVLVFAHAVQFWPAVRAHWRRVGASTRPAAVVE